MHTLENTLDLISQIFYAMEMNQNCWIAATQTQHRAVPLTQLEFAVKEKQFQVKGCYIMDCSAMESVKIIVRIDFKALLKLVMCCVFTAATQVYYCK